MPEPAAPLAPAKILVINVCRIGDTLLATPALRALALAYPAAEVSVLAHPKRVEVLENLPFVARVGAISKRSAGLRGRLPGTRYDLALVHGFDAALVAYALRAAHRVVAFRQNDESLNRRLHRAVQVPDFQSAHSVHLALRLADALNIAHAGYRLAYRVTDAEGAWAEGRLRALGLASRAPRVGLQVASFPTKGYRDWPVEQFSQLASRIRAAWPDAHFLIFGGPEERARTGRLAAELGDAGTLFAGTLSLRQTAALMQRTHLYVGVDTGPTHLMSCFDVPLVGLYHCASPSRLIGALDHPCFYAVDHPRPAPCSIETPMAEITVDAVFAAVERAMREHPPVA